MRPDSKIPENVSSPYPISCDTEVICGYGRGSSELGIPTANIPIDKNLDSLDSGIYFGWCKLAPKADKQPEVIISEAAKEISFNYGSFLSGEEVGVLPMVMSVGWNPFYNNAKKAAEIHIIHHFKHNFYGASIKFVILGYIRPELNYTTKGMYEA